MSDPLIWVRAIHYAAMIEQFGIFAFLQFVAEPAFAQGGDCGSRAGDRLHRVLLRLAWIGLAVGLVSGALWLILVAAEMSGRPFGRILPDGIVGIVLSRTSFGHVWEFRLAVTGILAGFVLGLA